jgi:hypothetical protein
MRSHFLWALVLAFALIVFPLKAADWSIDVVPQSSRDGEQAIALSDPFQVVLTNTTDHDLILWGEWCSWGYSNLSFEFSSKDGKVTKVFRPMTTWTRNGPDAFTVRPGKHFVLTVTLRSREKTHANWSGVESLEGLMTVKAIYKCTDEAFPGSKPQVKFHDDMQKLIDSGWVGQVESDPMQLRVFP